MRGRGKGGRRGWNRRSGSAGGWGRAMGRRGWGGVDGGRRRRSGVVGVVEGVLGGLIVLDSGEVDTAPRVSRLWTHHGHTIISFPE